MRLHLPFLGAACVALCALLPPPTLADAPQGVSVDVTLQSKIVSLGEPVVLNYRITNDEDEPVATNINHDPRQWLGMELDDAAGQTAVEVPDATPLRRHAGSVIPPNSVQTGTVLLTHWQQISHAGDYNLTLQVHLSSAWDTPTGEGSTSDQTDTLPLTVTARDPARLRADAEGFRQAALQDTDSGDAHLAAEALFSMRDPACLPIWRELAVNPHLDAFRATDVMQELALVGTAEAANILAEMSPIAPERWARTGTSPVVVLDQMRVTAGPELRNHIDGLLAGLGLPPGHRALGSASTVTE